MSELPKLDKYRHSDATDKKDDRWYIAKKGCKGIDLTEAEADRVLLHCDCYDELVAACRLVSIITKWIDEMRTVNLDNVPMALLEDIDIIKAALAKGKK